MKLESYKDVFIVCDSAVADFADRIAEETPSVRSLMYLDICQETKTMDTVLDICRFLVAAGAGRDSLLLAIGGGTTGDIAGFAASIYKRGMHFAMMPTTLLAMVDAAYGGKNGVNLDGLKNMLGAFREPEFVTPLYEALDTLPKREFLSGAAEMLKTFLISDEHLYRDAVRAVSEFNATGCGIDEIVRLIPLAAGYKKEIVAKDPEDLGLRHILNLGHNYAHALEWYEQAGSVPAPHTHGEAVAIGIVAETRLSETLGIARKGLASDIEKDFRSCGLPTELTVPVELLEPALRQDKKNDAKTANYVLLKSIGEVKSVAL